MNFRDLSVVREFIAAGRSAIRYPDRGAIRDYRTLISQTILLCSLGLSALAGIVTVPTTAAENASLAERFSKMEAADSLLPVSDWHPFPRVSEPAAWEQLPEDTRKRIVALADKYAACSVPTLPASLYLEFRRNGNRSRYQDVWFQRRAMLGGLALAECVQGEGRFLDPLADVMWAICEESSWTLPAHIGVQRAGSGLPDTTEPIVALFSAETASSLAWVVYLLEDRLDEVSPQICQRVRREIDRRILSPYLERDDLRWMGFHGGGRPNNWNPWINSNVLAAGLLIEQDATRRQELVDKVLRSLDRFFVPYPSDGSCDEGPSYWGRAGASLFDNLELLHSATRGKFDVYGDPNVREIGRFIYRMHIAGEAFVCVGDCDLRPHVPRDLVFRYGQRIEDPQMQALALSGGVGRELWSERRGPWSLTRLLYALSNLSALRSDRAEPPLLRDVWLGDADLQLMAARDADGTTAGLYVAAWGGHNGQSHNHNDVGNFLVYQNGQPALIDVGRPTYTRQTFSRDRYKIWAMQSAYHNLPSVNGHMQKAGRQYAAAEVSYRQDDAVAEIQLDIAPAYPPAAGIRSWVRTVRLLRGDSLHVIDDFTLREESSDIVQHLMTPCDVEVIREGELRLYSPDQGTDLLVRYDSPALRVEVETMEVDDDNLKEAWGPLLRRIQLRAAQPQTHGVWSLVIKPRE
jgi:hypothetical protein